MKTFKILFSATVVLLLVFTGCGNLFVPTGVLMEDAAFDSRAVTSSEYYDTGFLEEEEGILGPGAEYRISLPEGWQDYPEGQKNLLLYSHGYVTQGMDFSQTAEYDLINVVISGFVNAGFAVAYSSYAESGWAVKDGTIRTRQLRGYFVENIGVPDNIYLCGVSEGALIALKLAEQNPGLFSGVLAIAGPVGGALMEFEYILNVRLAFDHFFKDLLKGAAVGYPGILEPEPTAVSLSLALGYDLTGSEDSSAIDVLPDPDHSEYAYSTDFITDMAPLIGGLMMSDYDKTLEMASVMVDDNNLFPVDNWMINPTFIPEFVYTVATALWYNIYGTQDLIEKAHDHMPLDNTESIYMHLVFTGGYPTGQVAFDVERFESDPDAEQYLEHWYKPDGKLRIPVVTLHTTRDPAVPYFHEEAYTAIADSSGMLIPMYMTGFGHGMLLNYTTSGFEINFGDTLTAIIGAFKTLGEIVDPSALWHMFL